jgi:hypothetical protein
MVDLAWGLVVVHVVVIGATLGGYENQSGRCTDEDAEGVPMVDSKYVHVGAPAICGYVSLSFREFLKFGLIQNPRLSRSGCPILKLQHRHCHSVWRIWENDTGTIGYMSNAVITKLRLIAVSHIFNNDLSAELSGWSLAGIGYSYIHTGSTRIWQYAGGELKWTGGNGRPSALIDAHLSELPLQNQSREGRYHQAKEREYSNDAFESTHTQKSLFGLFCVGLLFDALGVIFFFCRRTTRLMAWGLICMALSLFLMAHGGYLYSFF